MTAGLVILFPIFYNCAMTLSRHSFLLKIGIAFAAVLLAAAGVLAAKILPFYPELTETAARRPAAALFFEPAFAAAPYAPFFTMLVSLVYALGLLILLFYFFEKNQAIEVHFFMFFVCSFIAEALRGILPLRPLFYLPAVSLNISAHCLVFCRYFGIFSLFFASLVAAGLKIEKEENIIFPLIIITLFISFRLPVNTYTWDTSLSMANGYPPSVSLLGLIVSIFTVINFICGALKRVIKEHYATALGALFVLTGRTLLFGGDSYALLAAGSILLISGSYIICVSLRRIYLWA